MEDYAFYARFKEREGMKKRCFYLDFIRSIAVIAILLTHYNANYLFLNDGAGFHKVVLTSRVANIYIGDFGVSLFLIISGAALMYTYENQLILKDFYRKRFKSIFPMFWICYLIVYSHSFLVNGGNPISAGRPTILLTLLGLDGYIGTAIPTYYMIGEWFLGFIIIVYVIFPLLRAGINKKPILTCVLVLALYGYFMLHYDIPFIKNIFLFIRLPEIVFGMVFVKYIKKIPWPVSVMAFVVLILNTIIKPQIDTSFQMTYIGISSFLLLAGVAKFFEKASFVTYLCKVISKYSYAVFLTHHYIISYVVSKFDLYKISVMESYVLFAIIVAMICLASRGLYFLNGYIDKQMSLIFSKDVTS